MTQPGAREPGRLFESAATPTWLEPAGGGTQSALKQDKLEAMAQVNLLPQETSNIPIDFSYKSCRTGEVRE